MKKHLKSLIILSAIIAAYVIGFYTHKNITAAPKEAFKNPVVADIYNEPITKQKMRSFHTPIRTRPQPAFIDVKYGLSDENTLDIYQAKSDKPTPVMVFIGSRVANSGNFGGRKNMSIDLFRKCLANGISVASVNYYVGHDIGIQDALRNCARVLQFLRHNAEKYNIDKNRLAVFGAGKGGGVSLWLGFHDDLADPESGDPVLRESSKPTVVGSSNGQCSYDLLQWPQIIGSNPALDKNIKEEHLFYGFKSRADLFSEEGKKIRADVDTLNLLTEDDPPVFLFSSWENTEPIDQDHYFRHPRHSIAIKQKCDQLGIDCEFPPIPAPGRSPITIPERNDMLLAFFMRYLKPEPGIAK